MSIQAESPNILLIIGDDVGVDVVNITGSGSSRAIEVHTNDGDVDIYGTLPNISRLLRNGLYFNQAWAQPACSNTRASIYTGLHPWKSGVGTPAGAELDSTAGFTTLPRLLPSDYVSGLFGKWHLGSVSGTWPTDHGWDKHVGTLDGVLPDYFNWSIQDSGSDPEYAPTKTTDYATWRTVKEAAAWINAQDPVTPWFATIAFHSPHEPFHVPPGGYDKATVGKADSDDYMFNIMVQNMDFNIGRLLGTSGIMGGPGYFKSIPEDHLSNTIIIFIGDNGSAKDVALEEEKNKIYEGSVRVPQIIADGQAVMQEINEEAISPRFLGAIRLNRLYQEMVHVVDLYKTIVRLVDPAADAFPADSDSVDFSTVLNPDLKVPIDPSTGLPVLIPSNRSFNFSQWYDSKGTRATIRNQNYKLNYNNNKIPEYALYKYSAGEIPGREDDGTAEDLFTAAIIHLNFAAAEILNSHDKNLNTLLNQLIANYQPDETNKFPDPRKRLGI